MKKRQLTGPESATSRPLADPIAAEPRSPPASIDPCMTGSIEDANNGIHLLYSNKEWYMSKWSINS